MTVNSGMRVVLTGSRGPLARGLIQALSIAPRDVLGRHSIEPIDLAKDNPTQRLRGADLVIHAALGGNLAQTGTIDMAVLRAATCRVILISSLSVLPYRDLAEGASVDSQTPTDPSADSRGIYARRKIAQEARFVAAGAPIVRVGAVVTREAPWTARLGFRRLGVGVLVDGSVPMPTVHPFTVATCIAGIPAGVSYAIDPQPPTQRAYVEALRLKGPWLSVSRGWADRLIGSTESAARFKPLLWPRTSDVPSTLTRLT